MKKLGKKMNVKETIEAYIPYCKHCACNCGEWDYTYDHTYIAKSDETSFPY